MSSLSQHYQSGDFFGRVYELQIASAALAAPDEKETLKRAYRYGNISGLNALHLQFTVEQQSGGVSKCHMTVANLSEAVRNNIRPKDAIRLYAGYPLSYGLVYIGYIETHESQQSGPDVLTRITCSGDPPEIAETKYSRSFTSSIKRSEILRDVQKRCKLRISSSGRSTVLQVARGTYTGIEDVVYPNGKALDGTPLEVLQLLFPDPLTVEVKDSVITITDKSKPFSRVVVALNAATGLVGTPGTTEHDQLTVYKFVSLLNIRLRAGAYVELTTSNAKKPVYCLVQTARFTGDTRSGPWFVECVATQVDPSNPDAATGSVSADFMDAFSPDEDATNGAEEGLEE